MATEKAFLEIEGGERVPCMFNPADLAVSRSTFWDGDVLPGKGVPKLRYSGSDSGFLRLHLTLDTTGDGSAVTQYTGKILSLMDIDTSIPGTDETTNNARPPYVTFNWGDLHSFKAVVSDLALTFTYFSSSGVPLRAQVDLVLRQYEPSSAFPRQNPTSGTPRPHRVHRVQPGETLDRISAKYYGDSTRWRTLATANGIEDPLAIRPGTLLAIPRMER